MILPPARRGMTLVEMMVATTMSLIIMGIIAQLFGMLGKGVTGSRSTLTLSEQLRAVGNTLRTDLAGLTVSTLPPSAPDGDAGYLEIIEGPAIDDPGVPRTSLTGDCDDSLLLTTRSLGNPFVGRFENGAIESQFAEVAWFCVEAPTQPVAGSTLYTLHRRQLLVIPYVGAGAFYASGANRISGSLATVSGTYDVSLRADGYGHLLPNSLSDLTKRENRFLHNLSGTISNASYPYDDFSQNLAATGPLTSLRAGEDVVLTNVVAFDIRLFDPNVPVKITTANTTALVPGDPGYASGSSTQAKGAYIDLIPSLTSSATSVGAVFPPAGVPAFQTHGVFVTGTSGAYNNRSLRPTVGTKTFGIYDTGSLHYESNGVDEDNDGSTDEGADGVDSNGDGVIDDAGERETSPPYPVALRGLEVRIRCYEPQSRQVRQVTVRHTFVPH
jgi:prepilin-type N-terminal cleavage/methylation domain-containing protein